MNDIDPRFASAHYMDGRDLYDEPIYSPTDMQAAAFGTWQSIKWGGFVALCVVAAVYWPYPSLPF